MHELLGLTWRGEELGLVGSRLGPQPCRNELLAALGAAVGGREAASCFTPSRGAVFAVQGTGQAQGLQL